jgi:predicted transcriptional regulator
MKTIRQIAEELGVSKQAVAKRIKREPLATDIQPHMKLTANVTYISAEGISLLKEDFATVRQPTPTANRQPTADNHVVTFLMEQLREKDKQLTTKDEQIAEKDKQIADLTEAVKSQAQSINADRHNELAGTLQGQLVSSTEDEAPADERAVATAASMEPTPKKRGIFGFFNKKE